MNITKFFSALMIFCIFTSCSICPWKTVKYVSCPYEQRMEIDFSKTNNEYSNCIIENVFFYFVSNGIEESMYESKGPYSLNFVFKSFEQNKIVTLNSIVLLIDGKRINYDKNLPSNIILDLPGYPNSDFYSGSYQTDYIYNLDKVKNISVIINVTVEKNGVPITKDLTATATKEVKRGIIQYRY